MGDTPRLARAAISLAVEGKAGESLAETVGDWRKEASEGKEKRLAYLCEQLGLSDRVNDAVRYQDFMHRTASALIEAERIGAIAAVMLVLSFADRPRFEVRLRRFYLLHGRQGRARLSRLRKRSREDAAISWLARTWPPRARPNADIADQVT